MALCKEDRVVKTLCYLTGVNPMTEIQSLDHFHELINSVKPVCALFTADWCPDCQVLKPVMPELEKEFSGDYQFLSVDRDRFLDLCQELNVFGIPSFIIYQEGKETGRFVSTARKTREEIDHFLRKTGNL